MIQKLSIAFYIVMAAFCVYLTYVNIAISL